MAEKHVLQAQQRDLQTKPAHYRRQDLLPANIYGVGASQAIVLPVKETAKLLTEISESTVFYLTLDDQEIPVMIAEVQKDPITGQYLHLALRQVDLKQKVTAMIPVTVTGDFSVPSALYLVVKDEVEAEALPTDLPEEFVIDVSKFTAVGQQITYADLDYDHDKVTLHFDSANEPLVVVNEVKEEVEPEPTATQDSADTATTTENAQAASDTSDKSSSN